MLLLYNIILSNYTIVGIKPDFKVSPAGLGLCLYTWQWKRTPQGRVETRTFSAGGLHYSNIGVPYNGRPWPASVHLCVCVCVTLHILAHIPIRVTHMHSQGSSIIHNRSYFYLWFVHWCKVRSALRSLAAICKPELSMRFRRQSFCVPNRSKSNISTRSEFRDEFWGKRLCWGTKRAMLHTWHFTLQTLCW